MSYAYELDSEISDLQISDLDQISDAEIDLRSEIDQIRSEILKLKLKLKLKIFTASASASGGRDLKFEI